MKSLKIISHVGVILSMSCTTYALAVYFSLSALSSMGQSLSVVLSGHAVMVTKIDAMLADHHSRDLILDELKARNEEYASLYEALTTLIANSKTHAFNGLLMWTAISVVCIALLIRVETLHRRGIT